jgi:hypothetical protein
MVMKNAKIFHSKGLPKCTKTGGLSLKVSHLATLLHAQQSRRALKIEKRVRVRNYKINGSPLGHFLS